MEINIKKIIIAMTLVVTMALMPLTVNGTDNIPLGDTLSPTISANSLEDFSKKLNELAPENIEAVADGVTIDEVYKLVIEKIEKGEDYLYLPDIDCEITDIRMFACSDQSSNQFASSKYGMMIHRGEKVALDTQCSFRYDNTDFRIGYCSPALTTGKMVLHNKEISYWLGSNSTVIYLKSGDPDIGILLKKP